jgi:hypothetical protein
VNGNVHDGHDGVVVAFKEEEKLGSSRMIFVSCTSQTHRFCIFFDCFERKASVGREVSTGSVSGLTGMEKRSSGKIDRGNSKNRTFRDEGKSFGNFFL